MISEYKYDRLLEELHEKEQHLVKRQKEYFILLRTYQSLLVKSAQQQAENIDLLNHVYLPKDPVVDNYRKFTYKIVKL